jgi:uncharacterized protein with FMN-binding domain
MKKSRKILLTIVIIIILLAITGKIIISNTTDNLEDLSAVTIEDVDLSMVSDGIYEGSYKVFPVEVVVEVTVEDHEITDIQITEHDNGQGDAAEEITEDVIKEQSLQVDAISGATYSSMVILLSIEDALKNAMDQ